MKAVIEIEVLPPTLNEIIRSAKDDWRAYARLKKDYTRDCALSAIGSPKFIGQVWLACDWRIKTKRRDPDNTAAALKFVLDGLVDVGIISDDSAFVIQPPIVHHWRQSNSEGLKLTISDRPIYQLVELAGQ